MNYLRGTEKAHRVLLGTRDLMLLEFLWRWKLATTAALGAKFFSCNFKNAYNRLNDLERANVIEVRCDEKLKNFAWAITQKGFKAIRSELPALKEEGFRSEHIQHDFLVSAFHIGDWLLEMPEGARLFSEQQLRRVLLDDYPSWVPRTEVHRPDGYWGLPASDKILTVALEVEIHRKSPQIYEAVGEFYAELSEVFRVIWLVPSIASARRIQSKIQKSRSVRANVHNFVLIPNFLKQAWHCPILLGPETGKTLSDFLHTVPGEVPVKRGGPLTGHYLLDTKKSFVKSRHLAVAEQIERPLLSTIQYSTQAHTTTTV